MYYMYTHYAQPCDTDARSRDARRGPKCVTASYTYIHVRHTVSGRAQKASCCEERQQRRHRASPAPRWRAAAAPSSSDQRRHNAAPRAAHRTAACCCVIIPTGRERADENECVPATRSFLRGLCVPVCVRGCLCVCVCMCSNCALRAAAKSHAG